MVNNEDPVFPWGWPRNGLQLKDWVRDGFSRAQIKVEGLDAQMIQFFGNSPSKRGGAATGSGDHGGVTVLPQVRDYFPHFCLPIALIPNLLEEHKALFSTCVL